MKAPARFVTLISLAVTALVLVTGCPLPFDYTGRGAGSSDATDPSSPKVTSVVQFSYAEDGGSSGTVQDGGTFTSGKTTTVTLSTATNNAYIYYTDDGTPITNVNAAKRISASSGSITVTRTTSLQTLSLHAVAIGPNMVPSPATQATVSVSPYPILSITVDKASVTEDNGTATFTVTSSLAPAADLTVNLSTGGSYSAAYLAGIAGPGTSFTKTLAAGTTSVSIPVTTSHDPSTASPTVTLTIVAETPPQTYSVGAPSVASLVIQDDASHMVTYNGNGNTGGTAPTDANYYTAGAPVTVLGNTGSLVRTGYAFAGWNTLADGSGTSYAAGATFAMGTANVTLYAMWTAAYYVNAVTGSDANPGTSSGAPFKTITKALSLAASGVTVNVAAGTYGTANGETFPIVIPAGVSLIGDSATRGTGVIILGGAEPPGFSPGFISAAVVMGAQSVLEGFTVTNNSGVTGNPMGVVYSVYSSSNGAVVKANTITGNPGGGIYVYGGSSGGAIDDNVLTANNPLWGLAFVNNGGNGMSISRNAFYDPVELDTAGPDLGGGAAGSPGLNSFLATSSTYIICGGTVYARNNHWNHSPPTVGAVQSGFDVGVGGGTTVDTTGYY